MNLTQLNLGNRYATNRNDLVVEFYSPCLDHSVSYDRAVGYFRSSVLLLAMRPIARLAARGGKIRLICSPELTLDDVEAIKNGYELREVIGNALCRAIQEGLEDSIGRPIVEFLATLVAIKSLDIKIAFRPGSRGVFHDKMGVFRDSEGHAVSFTGSSNETFSAWDASGNHESFDVFNSWGPDSERVSQHTEYFESLWRGQEPGVETVSFPEVAEERLIKTANPEGIEAALARVLTSGIQHRKVPMPHQLEALASWRANGNRGILEHATGSGKTFTAITAIRNWLHNGGAVLILVPSELLLKQWHQEIQVELSDLAPRILRVGAGHATWKDRDVVEAFSRSSGERRITIATLQSASKPAYFERVQVGQHLLVVIDEVHRAGSQSFSQVLTLDAGARMGLSATPRRYGDPEGTRRLLDYFGGVIEPRFTIQDAIAAGRLCPYTYHIHPVHLNQEEQDQWRVITEDLKRVIARVPRDESGQLTFNEYARLMLIKRARILKEASAKSGLAVEVLQEYYQHGQRWLIYCDSQAQLGQVRDALERSGLPSDEYHSAMQGDRQATMNYFTDLGGILVAIKCLDEGVDIPAVDHALILASSGNPREFIQRRGRVLRTAAEKSHAEIHDALVLPAADTLEPDDTSILRGEIARAAQFAQSAENESVRFRLRQLARSYNVDPDGLVANAGFEEEEP